MNRLFQLIALAGVTLVLATTATGVLTLPFLQVLILLAAGILASGFIHSAGKTAAVEATGVATQARIGIALGLRLLIGTAVLALILLSALWSTGIAH